MSEQSPWGQPPPPGNPGGGSYPPPPAQGPPGPPSGGPPGGSSPPKRKAGVVIAAVLGALVVIAAIAVTLVVTTGDDDVKASTGDPTSSSTSNGQPTDSPSETPSDTPSETPSDTPSEPVEAPKDAILGDGYFFELPGIGWQDALDEAQSTGLGSTLDSIIILGSSLDLAQSNILVEALTAGGAPDLEALEAQWKRNLSGADGAEPEDIPDITIDGERAIGVRFTDRENVNGILIDQIAYLALHEGNQYSVALTLPSENDTVSEGDFEKVLDSWSWTG